MVRECLLCAALIDSARASPQPCNRLILESEHFAVLPALGPLFPGHVMVVSKDHFPSLASMGAAGIKAYLKLVEALTVKWPDLMQTVLETEHGGVEADGPGPCVVHTHVNLIPHARTFAGILDGVLPVIRRGSITEELLRVHDPYFLMKAGDHASIYQGANGQSQLVRRLIATACGRDDWNWAIFSQDEWINETVQMWRDRQE